MLSQALLLHLAYVLNAATFLVLIVTAISISLKNRINEGTINQFTLQGTFLPSILSATTAIRIYFSGSFSSLIDADFVGNLIVVIFAFFFLLIQQYVVTDILKYIAGYRQRDAGRFLRRFELIAQDFRKRQTERRLRETRESINALLIDATLIAAIVVSALLLFAGSGITYVDNLIAALTLLVIGLQIMIRADDIVTQVMGLSVAFNGLYVVGFTFLSPGTNFGIDPQLQLLLLVCLFAGTTLSFVIAYILLPDLFNSAKTIEVREQAELNEEIEQDEQGGNQ